MILYVDGNQFHTQAQVLVNTVNTVGVMGKGIALEFKRLFPEMFDQYRDLCDLGRFTIGMLWLYKSSNKWVLNFPTKKHWRQPSQVEYIEAGLKKFVKIYADLDIHSIAFPPLGCGNGQLDFESQVQPLMDRYLKNLPIEVFIYSGKQNNFVEHLNPKEMRKWLRSEPIALPFSEVWEDLSEVLKVRHQFNTIAKGNPFEAHIIRKPLGIEILAPSQRRRIPFEALKSFWQQIRTYGFTMRHIAPGLDREISYLAAIFAELDYVAPVHLAEADYYDNPRSSIITGVQVLPSAFDLESQLAPQYTQMALV